MVLGGSSWFFFLGILGGFLGFLKILGGYRQFYVVLGDSWCFLVVLVFLCGSLWFSAVLCGF